MKTNLLLFVIKRLKILLFGLLLSAWFWEDLPGATIDNGYRFDTEKVKASVVLDNSGQEAYFFQSDQPHRITGQVTSSEDG